MQLLIAGDLVPTKSNIHLFNSAEINKLLGEDLLNVWEEADERIINLEAPITDIDEPILKFGPNLRIPSSAISGIVALKPSLFALANNHILDQGSKGLESTIDILNKNNISYVGVGNNLKESSRGKIIEKNNIKIGIYNCAENEFTIATDNESGANPFDPLESLTHIKELKEVCNYVIVLYHGGKEEYRYPSPYLQKICRKIVESGSDLVICQHSHCIGCFEEYNKSTIIYGQGNFIFDDCDNEFWKTSLLVRLVIEDNLKIEYIPIIKDKNVIRLAQGSEKNEIMRSFIKRSKEITSINFVQDKYNEYAKEKKDSYLRNFSDLNKWILRIDRYLLKGKLLNYKYNYKKFLMLQNYIECEAHRELILTFLKEKNSNKKIY